MLRGPQTANVRNFNDGVARRMFEARVTGFFRVNNKGRSPALPKDLGVELLGNTQFPWVRHGGGWGIGGPGARAAACSAGAGVPGRC